MATYYTFSYRCQYCEKTTQMRYRVPTSDYVTVTLSCKNCERAILSFYGRKYFKLYDEMRKIYILGTKDDKVASDALLAWVIDHNGDRFIE